MNIFVTDKNPEQSAINLDDKRVGHMPRECLELMSMFVYNRTGKLPMGVPLWDKHYREFQTLYNHPITKWVCDAVDHLHWLCDHTFYLILECEHRGMFNKYMSYKSLFNQLYRQEIRYYLVDRVLNVDNIKFRNSSLFKDKPIVKAYRDTMVEKWFYVDSGPIAWTNREQPNWVNVQKTLDFGSHISSVDNTDDLPF
jgi:hypothetical protein